jgi:small basic protein
MDGRLPTLQGEANRIMWWLPLLGLLVGLMLGLAFSLSIPAEYSRYTAVGILAALDSLLGAARADLDGSFDNRIFLSGFFANIVLAGLLTFLGDRLVFNNLAIIRRQMLARLAGPRKTQGANSD